MQDKTIVGKIIFDKDKLLSILDKDEIVEFIYHIFNAYSDDPDEGSLFELEENLTYNNVMDKFDSTELSFNFTIPESYALSRTVLDSVYISNIVEDKYIIHTLLSKLDSHLNTIFTVDAFEYLVPDEDFSYIKLNLNFTIISSKRINLYPEDVQREEFYSLGEMLDYANGNSTEYVVSHIENAIAEEEDYNSQFD